MGGDAAAMIEQARELVNVLRVTGGVDRGLGWTRPVPMVALNDHQVALIYPPPAAARGILRALGASCGQQRLIQARHQDCQQQGETLAVYLDTGQPTSDDPAYGSQRQEVLGLQGEQRALYIRQVADAYIQQCDQQEDAAAAAAAQAAADARARADAQAQQQAAQQHQADVLAKERATCAAVGGQWRDDLYNGICRIDYRSPTDGQTYHYTVSFDQDGNVTEVPGQGQADCHPGFAGSDRPTWHPGTKICAV